MPIHDWTRVKSGLFHHFHQDWSVEIARSLNRSQLPKGYYALVEQRVDGPEPDVIAVETNRRNSLAPGGSVALLDPPRTTQIAHIPDDTERYASKANRVSVHHPLGDVVAVIEIVSPGNKDSRNAIRSFVEKAAELLRAGIHLLIVDLFPPSDRDPLGIHKAITDEFAEEPYIPIPGKPLTLVSYQSAGAITAYIEPVAVGDALPDMPLFITRDGHIPLPLESTYLATWDATPEPVRDLVTMPS